MEWKGILALAVLALPISYCTILDTQERSAARKAVEIACIEQRGEITYNGKCSFD